MNKLIKIGFLLLALSVGPMQLVQAQAKAAGAGITINALSAAVISALTNMYAGLYNQAFDDYKALAYEFDPQLPVTIVNDNAQNSANTALNKAVQEQSTQMVANDFAGIRAKTQEQLSLVKQPASDDIIEGAAGKGFFTGTTDAFKADNEKAKAGDAAFNIESFWGPKTYSDKTSMDNAQAFLDQLKNFAPGPPVIRLAPKFDVPMINPQEPEKNMVTIGAKKPLSADALKKMRTKLQQDKDYRAYKRAYRAVVAARSVYLNNLLQTYQERVPKVDGKSALQIRDEGVNSRLTQEYYDKMSKASPATVARETLFVLAQINSQLNAIREQQERMIDMSSISGLNQLSLTAQILDMQAKQIGKKIYCMDPAHAKEKICTTDIEKVDASKVTGQTGGSDQLLPGM